MYLDYAVCGPEGSAVRGHLEGLRGSNGIAQWPDDALINLRFLSWRVIFIATGAHGEANDQENQRSHPLCQNFSSIHLVTPEDSSIRGVIHYCTLCALNLPLIVPSSRQPHSVSTIVTSPSKLPEITPPTGPYLSILTNPEWTSPPSAR